MRPRTCATAVLLPLLAGGCGERLPEAGWSEAPVLYRTAAPPQAALAPAAVGPPVFHVEGGADGLRVFPALSDASASALRQASLPAPDAEGRLPRKILICLPELAELAASLRRRAHFNLAGLKRYGFRQMLAGGEFDFLSVAGLCETGRPLDFAISGGDGREFMLLLHENALVRIKPGSGPPAASGAADVLVRAARFFETPGGVPKTADGYVAASTDFRPPPALVRVKAGVRLASADGVHFSAPAGSDWRELAAGRPLSGFLEAPNVDTRRLDDELRVCAELAALLDCLQVFRRQPPDGQEYMLAGDLPVTGEFLAAQGIGLRREAGFSVLNISRSGEHRSALIEALGGLLLKIRVLRENLQHAADTAPKPENLYRPRSVTLGASGRFEIRELEAAPRRIYAPKDANADAEGYVYTPNMVPELEREALAVTLDEYEMLRRLAERAFTDLLFPIISTSGSAAR